MRRRGFLKTLGLGATAAAGAVALPRFGRSQAPVPKRFVFVLSSNGFDASVLMRPSMRSWIGADFDPDRWWKGRYPNAGVEVERDYFTGPLTPALETLRTRGVDNQARVLFGLSSTQSAGGHTAQHGVLSSKRTSNGQPGGPTIDAYLASRPQVRGETPFDCVRVGISGRPDAISYDICAARAGQALPVVVDPVVAHRMFFGWALGGEAERSFAFRTRLLARARADATARLAGVAASEARAQLSTYERSLASLLARQEALARRAGDVVVPPAPDATLRPLEQYRAQMDLVGALLGQQLTNVAVVGLGAGNGFGGIYYRLPGHPITDSVHRHEICHSYHPYSRDTGEVSPATAAAARAAMREVWRQEIDGVAYLAEQLAATEDPLAPGSTMLDHTVLVYLPDNGEKHHADGTELATLLVGGRGLGLGEGGSAVVYPSLGGEAPSEHRETWNLWNTMLELAGEDPEFGSRTGRRALGSLSL